MAFALRGEQQRVWVAAQPRVGSRAVHTGSVSSTGPTLAGSRARRRHPARAAGECSVSPVVFVEGTARTVRDSLHNAEVWCRCRLRRTQGVRTIPADTSSSGRLATPVTWRPCGPHGCRGRVLVVIAGWARHLARREPELRTNRAVADGTIGASGHDTGRSDAHATGGVGALPACDLGYAMEHAATPRCSGASGQANH